MADKILNNPKLDSFEKQLASLAASETNIDRDRLMFEAGRQSVMQTETVRNRSIKLWRTSSILATCAAVVLAVLLTKRRVERPEKIVRDEFTLKKSSNDATVKKTQSPSQEIVQSELPEPENRFSNWVLAFFDILPAEDEFPTRRFAKFLEEKRYVSQRTQEDPVSSFPSRSPKTYLELMREFRQHTDNGRISIFRSDNSLDLFGEGR